MREGLSVRGVRVDPKSRRVLSWIWIGFNGWWLFCGIGSVLLAAYLGQRVWSDISALALGTAGLRIGLSALGLVGGLQIRRAIRRGWSKIQVAAWGLLITMATRSVVAHAGALRELLPMGADLRAALLYVGMYMLEDIVALALLVYAVLVVSNPANRAIFLEKADPEPRLRIP